MDLGYSPYRTDSKPQRSFRLPFKIPDFKMPAGVKKWIAIVLGGVVALLLIVYLLLGDLRFFANHYFGFTFFSKRYVILLQNNYELRPTGGFLTGYGEIDTTLGIPGSLIFKNSYDIDTASYVTPPKPQEDLLKNEWYQGYTFRDANWEPDLRRSAVDLKKFYETKFPGKKVDGFVVVNFSLIEDLLDKMGGVTLNGVKYDKNSLFGELEFAVNNIDRHNVENLANRKNVLGDVAKAILSKAKWHLFDLRDVIEEGLKNKNIQLWLADENLENLLVEKNWAGAMIPADQSDFLAVNLGNYGAKKADRYLLSDVNYYANLRGEIPEITTEVTLRYPGGTNSYADNYKGYLRLYIPKNATVSSLPVDTDNAADENFRVLGTKIILPAGSKMNLTYVYTLPRNIFVANQFKLRLVRQSGVLRGYSVIAEMPEGLRVTGSDFESRENRGYFSGKLVRDTDLALTASPDMKPPYSIEQEFEDLSHIRIFWNKPVDGVEAKNPANYSITDMNKTDPKTDLVKITKAELVEPNVIRLELEGVTGQKLEQYRLNLIRLMDPMGNKISPDPKTLTVVQRFNKKTTDTAPAVKQPASPFLIPE